MTRKISVTTLVLLAFVVAGYAGPKFVTTWKDPTAGKFNLKGKKVAAIVISSYTSVRVGGETSLAYELTKRGAQGIAGHTLLPEEISRADKSEEARKKLEEAGIEHAVIMRATAREKTQSDATGTLLIYSTSPVYSSFWGYWGSSWDATYDYGNIQSQTVMTVETLVWSVAEDKLLWAGRSKTTSPKNLGKFIRKLVDAASKEIRKEGLIEK